VSKPGDLCIFGSATTPHAKLLQETANMIGYTYKRLTHWVLLGLLIMSSFHPGQTVRAQDRQNIAESALSVLQSWYNPTTGLWETTGWWNSANALYTVIDYASYTKSTSYNDVIATTFRMNAPNSFLNKFYDDEGWWALTWLHAYELTQDKAYLDMAVTIFKDMTAGWDDTCGGGLWWSKDRTYKNAIPNELFLQLAARLHNLTPDDQGTGSYLDWAQREWNWFKASGLINARSLVNDGLKDCKNNDDIPWTYNQGVILGGLVELNKATGDITLLDQAQAIADAALKYLVDNSSSVLREPCELANSCGNDGPQFKGIFIRNLYFLTQTVANQATYTDFILKNADSIWAKDRNASNQLGLKWYGKFDRGDAARQSSALDALNAAMKVTAHSTK